MFDLASCYEKTGNTQLAIETFEAYIKAVKKNDPAAAERAKNAIANLEKK